MEKDLSPVSKYNNEEQSTRRQVLEENNDAPRGQNEGAELRSKVDREEINEEACYAPCFPFPGPVHVAG